MIEITCITEKIGEFLKAFYGDKVRFDVETFLYPVLNACIYGEVEFKIRPAENLDESLLGFYDVVFMKKGHVLFTMKANEFAGIHIH